MNSTYNVIILKSLLYLQLAVTSHLVHTLWASVLVSHMPSWRSLLLMTTQQSCQSTLHWWSPLWTDQMLWRLAHPTLQPSLLKIMNQVRLQPFATLLKNACTFSTNNTMLNMGIQSHVYVCLCVCMCANIFTYIVCILVCMCLEWSSKVHELINAHAMQCYV